MGIIGVYPRGFRPQNCGLVLVGARLMGCMFDSRYPGRRRWHRTSKLQAAALAVWHCSTEEQRATKRERGMGFSIGTCVETTLGTGVLVEIRQEDDVHVVRLWRSRGMFMFGNIHNLDAIVSTALHNAAHLQAQSINAAKHTWCYVREALISSGSLLHSHLVAVVYQPRPL